LLGQLENEETTFKKVGSALTKIIRFNAITEESIGISKEKKRKYVKLNMLNKIFQINSLL